MGTTSPDAIAYADGGTPAALEAITATMAASIQAAFDARATSYTWASDAARLAQTGMSAGDTGWGDWNDSRWYYDGAQWIRTINIFTSAIAPVGALEGDVWIVKV